MVFSLCSRTYPYLSELSIFIQKFATLKKIWVEVNIKKYQVPPYENLGRFYRVPIKSLLRVQILRGEYHKNLSDNIYGFWDDINTCPPHKDSAKLSVLSISK